ncbi:MAG: CHASE2 domain-containing protein [Acetatifactor sp.]|nr:CHASE2 domain-containing protein [Acetatifactor sp.]
MKEKGRFFLTTLISIGIALVVAVASAKGFFKSVEPMLEDRAYQRAEAIPDDIKIIAIDEKTLSRLGTYTDWDRSYFAQLLDILNADEETAPGVIGMDVVFSGSNQTEADKKLVESAGRYRNIVVASSLTLDSYPCKDERGNYYSVTYVSNEAKPFAELAEVVDWGFANNIFDADGFVRKAYTEIISEYENQKSTYDSFAKKVVSKLGEMPDFAPIVEIGFTGKPGEFETISMADVLDGVVPAEYFRDCVVLVGAYEEGMMDAYRVPTDYSREMYGVELQANYIHALLEHRIQYTVNDTVMFPVILLFITLYGIFAFRTGMRKSILGLFGFIVGYIGLAMFVFGLTAHKMDLLTVPVGIVLTFLVAVLFRHYEMQRNNLREMRDMLFSMAEAMAEAIEGRTPYNANHTKNVAKRCVEMLDYINQQHREKKTDLYFTKAERQQLYLAAMLHDVGKMDVPLEVMDKPTKLGNRERELRDRLEIIKLRLECDFLNGYIDRDSAEERITKIKSFLGNLGAFNCGRPLKEEEWAIVNEMAESVYVGPKGEEIPYLTGEEIDDLHIKAGTLSDQERTIMQSHVIYTDKILSHMKFGEQFRKVRAMASNHHELLNGRGYPNGIGEEQIDTMTRILTIMDIYDSLIADDRPYKKPKPVKVAFDILDEEAEAGKVDRELLQFAKELYLKENE